MIRNIIKKAGNQMNRFILIYLLSINVGTFLMFAFDKQKAIHHQYRTPELTLLWGCFLGGSLGGWLAMSLFHHKTQKKKFTIGIPLIMLFHLVVLLLALFLVRFY